MTHTEFGAVLLDCAREALHGAFGLRADRSSASRHPALDAPGATFVTLTQFGELRGCIGTLKAHRPLRQDVEQNALAAAFHDPRFSPLGENELGWTCIEVSLLSPPVDFSVTDEADLLAQLQPGVDGLVIEWRDRRATFLPQMWESLTDPREFVAALKHKAGIAPRIWDRNMRVSRYSVEKWKETETQARRGVHQ